MVDEVAPTPDDEQVLPPSYTAPFGPDDDRGFVPLHPADGQPPEQPAGGEPALPPEETEELAP